MPLRPSLITIVALLALMIHGCATHHDAAVQHHHSQDIRRNHHLLAATNDTPGSFYELGVYVIGAGDTVSRIAHQFQVSASDILAINPGLDPTRLLIGQRVRIYERRKE